MSKKIITFLGTGNYQETTYEYTVKENGEKVTMRTRFVQEVIHKIVGEDAILYVGLTELARKTNWIDRVEKVKDDHEEKTIFLKGLRPILDCQNISYREIYLADGKNEEEMWKNFDSIFEILEEGDEVYVDVTHSFRSLPIIIMSVLNYAKFIKNIDIKGMYYGAFEAKTDSGVTPIFDLSLFNTITDWTIGAERFINTGDNEHLSKMIATTIHPILKETKGKDEEASMFKRINKAIDSFSSSLYTVRGNNISEYGIELKSALEQVKSIELYDLKPFEKILDKVYEKVYFYSNDTVNDIHNTVKLCRDLKLIQQAYTFLQENIINYLCIKRDIDIYNEVDRISVSRVIGYYHPYLKIELLEEDRDIKEKIKDYISIDIANLFIEIGKYRNDMNHAGYRRDPKKANSFISKLDDHIKDFERIINL